MGPDLSKIDNRIQAQMGPPPPLAGDDPFSVWGPGNNSGIVPGASDPRLRSVPAEMFLPPLTKLIDTKSGREPPALAPKVVGGVLGKKPGLINGAQSLQVAADNVLINPMFFLPRVD